MLCKIYYSRSICNFDIFFNFLTNKVYLKNRYVWNVYDISYDFFFPFVKDNSRSLNFKLSTKDQISSSIYWNVLSMYKRFLTGYYIELELLGLGFRLKKLSNFLYRFFWGYATYLYLLVPSNVLMQYSFDDKKVFAFSTNFLTLNDICSYLLLLRKLNVYRITGLLRPGKIIRLNSGKQR